MSTWNDRMAWDLAFAKRAERTRKLYVGDPRSFSGFFDRSPEELGQGEVRTWVEHLVAAGTSPSRLRQHMSALVFLYRKTLGRPEAVSFFSWPKDGERLPVVLSVAEVSALLAAVEGDNYRMLFRTMYASGLRVREACRLKIEHLDGTRGVIRVIGKGDQERQAALHDRLLEALRAYWREVRPVEPWLFTGRTGKPLDPDQARKVFKAVRRSDAVRMVGLTKRATPHALRHTYATLLLEHGTDLRVIPPPTQCVVGDLRTGAAGACFDPVHRAVPARRHAPDRRERRSPGAPAALSPGGGGRSPSRRTPPA